MSASSASTITCSALLLSFSPTANCNGALLARFQFTTVAPLPQLKCRSSEEIVEVTDFGGQAHADWMRRYARVLQGKRRAERAVERPDVVDCERVAERGASKLTAPARKRLRSRWAGRPVLREKSTRPQECRKLRECPCLETRPRIVLSGAGQSKGRTFRRGSACARCDASQPQELHDVVLNLRRRADRRHADARAGDWSWRWAGSTLSIAKD
jgi:hypothetical protein